MPLDVIDNTLNSLLEYKQWLYGLYDWSKQPSLYFIWHGGEPLVIGLDRMNETLAIKEKYRKLHTCLLLRYEYFSRARRLF